MSRHTRIYRMPSWTSTEVENMWVKEWKYERHNKKRISARRAGKSNNQEFLGWYEQEICPEVLKVKRLKGREMFWTQSGRMLKPKH